MIAEQGRLAWQASTGYGQRSLVETTMGRYKTLIGPRLCGPTDRSCHRRGSAKPDVGGRTPGFCPSPAGHRITTWGRGHLALRLEVHQRPRNAVGDPGWVSIKCRTRHQRWTWFLPSKSQTLRPPACVLIRRAGLRMPPFKQGAGFSRDHRSIKSDVVANDMVAVHRQLAQHIAMSPNGADRISNARALKLLA
jgi:hypothetical protein